MKLDIVIEVWQKEKWHIARSPELDFIAQGKTPEEAKDMLFEVIQIHFREMKEMGTLENYLKECGFHLKDERLVPLNQMLAIEKHSVEVL